MIADFKTVLVVVAMESEEQALLSGVESRTVVLGKKVQITIREIRAGGRTILVGRSGIGLVNAGILLASVAENYPVDAVILLGVGGALDPTLEIGDLVIARQVIQHDSISSLDGGDVLIAPGELILTRSDEALLSPVMDCAPELVTWIARVFTGRVFEGTIVSGSEFAGRAERKRKLRALTSDALMVDMEAAALAQICRRFSIPFVAAKTVADRANPDSSVAQDYMRFLSAAAQRSREVLAGLLGL